MCTHLANCQAVIAWVSSIPSMDQNFNHTLMVKQYTGMLCSEQPGLTSRATVHLLKALLHAPVTQQRRAPDWTRWFKRKSNEELPERRHKIDQVL